MDTLVIIPARGNSKGIPGKNIKLLGNIPLIHYSIDLARKLFQDQFICVTTDDEEIKRIVEESGLSVPFIRPSELATDQASTQDVMLHALAYYEGMYNHTFKKILLLQPTSPFRREFHIVEAMEKYDDEIDMVVSVKETKANPYFTLFESTENGFIVRSKEGAFTRRQDCPIIYELNGSIYIINAASVKSRKISEFNRVKAYVMQNVYSVDIDTPLDWIFAEAVLDELTIK